MLKASNSRGFLLKRRSWGSIAAGKARGKGSQRDVPSRCLCPAGGEHYRGVVGQPGISSHYQ